MSLVRISCTFFMGVNKIGVPRVLWNCIIFKDKEHFAKFFYHVAACTIRSFVKCGFIVTIFWTTGNAGIPSKEAAYATASRPSWKLPPLFFCKFEFYKHPALGHFAKSNGLASYVKSIWWVVKPLILPCRGSCCHSETVIPPHPSDTCQFSVYEPSCHVHSIQCIPWCLEYCCLFFRSYSHLDCVTRKAYWCVGLHCLSSVSTCKSMTTMTLLRSYSFTIMFNTFWILCSLVIKNVPKALYSVTHRFFFPLTFVILPSSLWFCHLYCKILLQLPIDI
jgi:hypothetical protein